MAKLLKLRRGTTTQHGSFTGAEGEVTIDTTKDTAVVHDGSTAGGTPLAKEDMSNVSSASIAGRLGADSIAVTKIAAGTLPNDVKIVSANIQNNSITNADIAPTAAIEGTKLENSGVTAGQYGSSSAIPIVTVDAQGLVTAASTTAVDSTKIQSGSTEVATANTHVSIKIGGTEKVAVESGTTTFSNNIAFSGTRTVAGRNIATDGSKLDGIESGATADQTAAEIRALVNSASDSNVFTDALLSKLNGVAASATNVTNNNQITNGAGYITAAQVFPSGTKMIFQQTSAPTGWTKITSGINNHALRVVSGTAGSGGNVAFSTAFAARAINANASNTTAGGNVSSSAGNTTAGGNVSVSTGNSGVSGNVSIGNTAQGGNVSIGSTSTGGNVNSHTLSTNQMPSHNHSFTSYTSSGRSRNYASGMRGYSNSRVEGSTTVNVNSTGGNGGHSHGFSGSSHNHNASFSGSNHSHNASFSGSSHSHNASGSFSGTAHNHNVSSSFSGSAHNHSISVGNLDMAVEYIDVIIAQKN